MFFSTCEQYIWILTINKDVNFEDISRWLTQRSIVPQPPKGIFHVIMPSSFTLFYCLCSYVRGVSFPLNGLFISSTISVYMHKSSFWNCPVVLLS